jgi:hypothetical protein
MLGARRIDPDALIAYRYQMWTEGLFRAGPALAIGAFSIEALALGPQMRQVIPAGVSDYFRPWIAMAEAHVKAAISNEKWSDA